MANRKQHVPKHVPSVRVATILANEFGTNAPASIRPYYVRSLGALRAKDGPTLKRLASEATATAVAVDEQFFAAQLGALTKRMEGLQGFDPESKARSRWEAAEHRCRRTNQRLRAWSTRTTKVRPYADRIDAARRFVRAVLGDSPYEERTFSEILGSCRFGPGTTTTTHGDATHLCAKLMSEWVATPTCMPFVIAALARVPVIHQLLGFSNGSFLCLDPDGFRDAVVEKTRCHDSNDNVMWVPKNSETHRAIGQPVLLNGFVQNGIGDWLTSRLQDFGIDLRDQSKNQRLARKGSSTDPHPRGPWATIDLEMASDTISQEIVRLLVPPEWYTFLSRVRVPTYTLDGKVRDYHKFSAMGNGFTFPLESLIFAALCHAVTGLRADHYDDFGRDGFSVYGDDLIIRQSYALELVELLAFAGFRTNVDKTFLFGSFRESCGEDYVDGFNIRPAFVKGERLDIIQLVGVHNRLMRSAFFVPFIALQRLRSLWPDRRVPLRLWGGVDDGAFMVPFEDFLSSGPRPDMGYQAYVGYSLTVEPVHDDTDFGPVLSMAAALAGASSQEGAPRFAYRRRRRNGVRRLTGPDPISRGWLFGPPRPGRG